ncbi:FAD-dependent oxidoreductase [Streptomyces sp. NPDC006460]|uniref:FAD-dependent oxidoreductase n=1 Tax=Streptomyces sp. NPDC006460 TaxID=3154304 RepID=UPI0033ACB570
MTPKDRTGTTVHLTTEIAVIGGGLGAVAAALAAAREGRGVVLAAHLGRLGGQATTQLVPALDEHPHVETAGVSTSYRAFRDLVRAHYDGILNPGGGWVSRLCFEPRAAEQAIDALLAPHLATGRITVLRSVQPIAAQRGNDRVDTVTLAGPGGRFEVTAELFLDATEDGRLLPLTSTPWVAGSEGQDAFGEVLALDGGPHPDAVQSCTVGFAVFYEPHTPALIGPPPADYTDLKSSQPFTLEIAGWDDRLHRYRMFTDGPDGHPPFWTYRRLRDSAQLAGPDIALINWAGNDYAGVSSLAEPDTAYRKAKELSAAFLHWLRTDCPRDDGTGTGYSGLHLSPSTAGTPDGYAEEPYLRESRRLRHDAPIRQQDLEPTPGAARAINQPDSAGLASYHMDLHARIGHPASAYAPTAPFQVPLSALVSDTTVNLLAAAKNLAATQVAASAYRVHHGEWAVGEAAGTLAALSVEQTRTPRAVLADRRMLTRLQMRLTTAGVPLAWLTDLQPTDPLGPSAHLLAAAGALTGPREKDLHLRPDDTATEQEQQALLAAAARLLDERHLTRTTTGEQPTWRELAHRLGTLVAGAVDPDAPPRPHHAPHAARTADAPSSQGAAK